VNIEQALYKLLKTDAAVSGFVAGRIFAGVMPQQVETYPAIAYRAPAAGGRGAGSRETFHTLPSGCTLVRQRLQVFSAAKTYGEAALLDEAVYTLLDEFRGTVIRDGSSPEESIDIQGVFLGDPAHAYVFEDKTQLHQFVSEFAFNFIDPSRIP
jgi:hypothetical protein